MLGGDATLYQLCEMLGRSPSEIRRLPNSDIVELRAYLVVKAEYEKLYAPSR